MQYGESVDVADWFSGFCIVHDTSDGMPEGEQQAATAPKPKKRRGRPSRKVLQRVSSQYLPFKSIILTNCLYRHFSECNRFNHARHLMRILMVQATTTHQIAMTTPGPSKLAASKTQQGFLYRDHWKKSSIF